MLSNILHIEDDRAGRRLMSEALKVASPQWKLSSVENGDEAMLFLKREGKFLDSVTPDLILLDLNMPGKNGVEVVNEIRSDDRFKNIPIVILTGSSASSDIQACSKLNCKYLLKPSGFHELVELVKSLPDFQ